MKHKIWKVKIFKSKLQNSGRDATGFRQPLELSQQIVSARAAVLAFPFLVTAYAITYLATAFAMDPFKNYFTVSFYIFARYYWI